MGLCEALLARIEDEPAAEVAVGARYVAVRVGSRIGLAHRDPEHRAPVDGARLVGARLARGILDGDPTRRALGAAAINAQLPIPPGERRDVFDHILATAERYRRIGVVGYFPFVEPLRARLGPERLLVFDRRPLPGSLPEAREAELLPTCDCAVITGSAFANGTLESLLRMARGVRMVIGPSTPLSGVLLEHGADCVAGLRVEDRRVLAVVAAGGGTRGFKRYAEEVLIERTGPQG